MIERKLLLEYRILMNEYEQTMTDRHLGISKLAEMFSLSANELLNVEKDLEEKGLIKLRFKEDGSLKTSRVTEDGIAYGQRLKFVDRLMVDISTYLRKGIYDEPDNEIEIQNTLEYLLTVLQYDFERALESVPTVTKYTLPDFTFGRNDVAMEVKYCHNKKREKDIIDQMNADITSYLSKFEILLFVVYDISTIRDTDRFETGFEERNERVFVQTIKH